MMLEVKNLSFSYENGNQIFHDVNFTLEKGAVLSILGPNGAGKSTLLNCLDNLEVPDEGSIILNGKELKTMSLREIAKVAAYVPQIHIPAYEYTVEEFVLMGRAPHIGAFASPGRQDYKLVHEALELLGIQDLASKKYTKISGGQRQQACIARAVVQQPRLILLDEPTAHLDFGNQIKTIRLIKTLACEGFGIIITTHNPDHVFSLGGYAALLDRTGRITFGKPEEILTEEILTDLYQEPVHILYSYELKRKICISGD